MKKAFILVLLILTSSVAKAEITPAQETEFKGKIVEFFNLVKDKKADQVLASFSSEAKAKVNLEAVQKFISQYPIQSIDPTANKSFASADGWVETKDLFTVKLADGSVKTPVVVFIAEGGAQKVLAVYFEYYDFKKSDLALQEEGSYLGAYPMPAFAEIQSNIIKVIMDMGEDINTGKPGKFYPWLSAAMQQKFTPQALLDLFNGFKEQKIDLTVVKGSQPVFETGPSLLTVKEFKVQGYVPSTPAFTFKFIFDYENGGWKINSFNVNLK